MSRTIASWALAGLPLAVETVMGRLDVESLCIQVFLDELDERTSSSTTTLGERWGAYDNMPDWEVNEALTARNWGIPRFWIQAGLHDPDIVMARFDYAYDPDAARALEAIGFDASTLELTDADEAARALEAIGFDASS
jgi:hypothetical protein